MASSRPDRGTSGRAPPPVVVGAGPNGLAAAALLAREGYAPRVLEAHETLGGGTRSAQLTLPGFVHDVCSAVHPLAVASPFLAGLPLQEHGLRWAHPPVALAHPLDDGSAVTLEREVDATAAGLGRDGDAYRALMRPLVAAWPALAQEVLGPVLHLPRRPWPLARFGVRALWPARLLARGAFSDERARALFAGVAAHGMMPLDAPASAAIGLVLTAAGHAVGWPFVAGGSQRLADALAAYVRDRGGEIVTGQRVDSLEQIADRSVVLCDLTPRELLRVAGPRLGGGYRRSLERYRYGPGVFKIDYALDAPVPWTAEACRRAGTVHLGGTLAEIADAEGQVARGELPERPFVLLAQPSLFDEERAPAGRHTLWAYCHVPSGSGADMTGVIEAQIERFAPGFRERVLARHARTAIELERDNPNFVGGDINGGMLSLRQIVARPTWRPVPYSTPDPLLFVCSSATPPGGGVHGMSGYHAARAALRRLRGAEGTRGR